MSRVDRSSSTVPPVPAVEPDSSDVGPTGLLGLLHRMGASLMARQRVDRFEPKGDTQSQVLDGTPITGQTFDPWTPGARSAGVPSSRELLSLLHPLRRQPLTSTERDAILHLSAPQRRQFGVTLEAIEEVKSGQLDAAGYFLRCLQSAADIAGSNGREFVDLVHLSFSNPKMSNPVVELARKALGAGPNAAGEVLETTFQSLVGKQNAAAEGFNPNVRDAVDPDHNTITHHFAEFLKVGYARDQHLSELAVHLTDRAGKNPGDVRNGLFAVMLGSGLKRGDLSPQDAVTLARWAMTRDGEEDSPTPPWGVSAGNRGLSGADFDLAQWQATLHGHAH